MAYKKQNTHYILYRIYTYSKIVTDLVSNGKLDVFSNSQNSRVHFLGGYFYYLHLNFLFFLLFAFIPNLVPLIFFLVFFIHYLFLLLHVFIAECMDHFEYRQTNTKRNPTYRMTSTISRYEHLATISAKFVESQMCCFVRYVKISPTFYLNNLHNSSCVSPYMHIQCFNPTNFAIGCWLWQKHPYFTVKASPSH